MQALKRLQRAGVNIKGQVHVPGDVRGVTTLLESRAVLRVAGTDTLSFLQVGVPQLAWLSQS